jgi:hypothetical protein
MSRAIVLALLLACGGKQDDPAATQTSVPALVATAPFPGKRAKVAKAAPPKVGDKETIVRDNRILGQLRHKEGPSGGFDMVESWTCEIEVLAVEGDLLRRRASFPDEAFVHRQDGKKLPTKQLLLRGHSYLAETRGTKLVVLREDGTQMTADEQRKVETILEDRGEPVHDAIVEKSIESGRVIALPLAAMAQYVADGVVLAKAELQLIDVRGDTATFEVHLVGDVAGNVGRRAFESRDLSEWSISKGRTFKLKGAAIFTGGEGPDLEAWNRLDGTITTTYAD